MAALHSMLYIIIAKACYVHSLTLFFLLLYQAALASKLLIWQTTMPTYNRHSLSVFLPIYGPVYVLFYKHWQGGSFAFINDVDDDNVDGAGTTRANTPFSFYGTLKVTTTATTI